MVVISWAVGIGEGGVSMTSLKTECFGFKVYLVREGRHQQKSHDINIYMEG